MKKNTRLIPWSFKYVLYMAFLFAMSAGMPLPTMAQTDAVIKGKIVDENNAALVGVTVLIKNTQKGTLSDANGNYSINANANETVLVFKYIGYTDQEVTVNGRTKIDVKLIPDKKNLNDVVVIGYGTVKKSDLTGAISTISSDKITQVKGISNVAQALQGQAAGVQVNQASGQPGQAMIIKIRGTNSMTASSNPLYVVDGVPLDALSAQLNPDDIESMQILKDASSIAIYGSRGANGVVMITTKKGKTGKAKVAYNGYYGRQTLRKKIDLVSASEYAQLQNEAVTNDNAAGLNTPNLPLPWTQEQINSLGAGTDWQDLVYRPANVQNHDLSISGGSESTKYYTSFGYYGQDGIIKNSGFNRASFRLNLSSELNKKLTLNTNLSIQNSKYKQAVANADGGGGIAFTTMVMPPTQGVYDAQGAYTRFTGVQWGETNPVGISKEVYSPSNNLRIIGNVGLRYNIIEGLNLNLGAGIDAGFDKNDYYAPSVISIGNTSETVNGVNKPLQGIASKGYGNSTSFITENTLSYNKTFNEKHTIDAVAGISYQKSKSEGVSASANGFVTDLFQNNNLGGTIASNKNTPSSSYSDFALLSYLGRFNYNYAGKYYATLTGRYDGSSKFGENNKYAFFPSAGLAWRISEEDFLKQSQVISNLKLRTSYGISGTQAISPYQTLARVNNQTINLNGAQVIGYTQGALSNPSLKWETTKQFDLGVDVGFLKNRIQLTADYYDKTTKNLLFPVTLPPSSGFGSVVQNVGSLSNKGFELQLTTQNIKGDGLNWTSVLTVSRNVNKILSLGNDPNGNPITYKEFVTGGNWFPSIVGQGIAELYGYKIIGVYATDAEAIANGEPGKKAGNYKRQNFGGPGHIIDASDRVTLTHLQPKFTYGFNNNLSYKNFDLSVLIVGSYGNDIVNEFRKYNLTMNGNWTPTQEAFDNRWQKPGDNGFDKPGKNSVGELRDLANSLWVENGSYLRFRDITLGYTFSANALRAIKVSSIRLYISAQNMFTITKYSGYDPEASWSTSSVNGWDRGVYPASKSVIGGATVNF